MLCTPSPLSTPLDRSACQQEPPSPLAIAPSLPSHYISSVRAQSPSTSTGPSNASRENHSMTSATSSPAPPVRPRHHIRSFSVENRFAPASSSSSSSSISRASSIHNGNAEGLPSPSIVIDPSSPPATNISPPFVSTSPLPVRVKRSPPLHTTSPSLGNSPIASPTKRDASPQSLSPSRVNEGSPVKSAKTLEAEKEQERLMLIKQQQANRRPKMMRLTPAFSSTPTSLRDSKSSSAASRESASNDLQFPPKKGDNEGEPGAGLQIDLGCIPTPSLQDLHGPISTSHLDSLIRDRNGNPIKPSLKSPRASVSHFLPGRTSRSDSTPALPSSLHSKSVPSTPTVHKAVHFDSQLEHVKLFKNKQRPTAVSRDGSPEQTETETEEEKDLFPYIWRKNGSNNTSPTATNFFGADSASTSTSGAHPGMTRSISPHVETEEQLVLRLPNFPSSTRLSVDREIFLERIFLAEDLRSVKGSVQVRNMSFEKWVAIRYTLDHWATIGEVSAEYSETIKGGQADRFTFSIKLNELLNWPRGSAAHETKSMFMCLRYTVNSTEFWDNNEGLNYQLDFRKRQVPSTPLSTPTAAALPLAQPRASVAQSNATRSKVFEIARRGVTGAKGMFAMEDLKRELDKLRSDEEEEDKQNNATPRSLVSELAKKKASPPTSPGRSSSPSATAWTARYDFGQSLRNPRSGSRNTGSGRAAALDYFSAKPMSRTNSAQQGSHVSNGHAQSALHSGDNGNGKAKSTEESQSTLQASPALNPGKFDEVSVQKAKRSPDFSHRFGMLSPGLADGPVEHHPTVSTSASGTPSASVSPSPTPTPSTNQSPMSAQSYSSDRNRFHSFPPTRHSGSNTPTNGTSMSPAFFTPTEEFEGGGGVVSSSISNAEMLNYVTTAFKADEAGLPRGNGLIVTSYSPSASPISDCESPNPFSPTDSLSSVESDTTISHSTTPDDRHQQRLKGLTSFGHARRSDGSSGSISSIGSFGSALQGGSLTASSSIASLDIPGSFSSSFHSPGGTATMPVRNDATVRGTAQPHQQEQKDDDADKLRPASMSDYQELINKYCWNNDLVPSGGSTIPDMPANGGLNGSMTLPVDGRQATKPSPLLKSPALSGSGASTPTPR